MGKKVSLSGINAGQSVPQTTPVQQQDEEPSIFDENGNMLDPEINANENDKALFRQVNDEPEKRKIRIGKDLDGKKYRYTDDTHEELIAKTTAGKNTYLTKAEFDRQVREMLQVDALPEGIKAEFREGCIVFINEETGLSMSASELKNDERILAAQDSKRLKDNLAKIEPVSVSQTSGFAASLPNVNIDEIDINIPEPERQTVDEASLKIDPNWYTEEGVRALEKEWGNVVPKSKGFNHKFYQGIVDIAKEILCDPDDLMSLINAESSFRPNIKSGLMGFVGVTRSKYKFEPKKLTPNQQLPYIRRYMLDSKELVFGKDSNHALSAGELYSIIFVPGYVKGALNDPKRILLSATSKNPKKREFYNNPINKRLDIGKKGYITIEDLAQRIEEKNAYNTSRKMHIAYNGERHNSYGVPKADETLLAEVTPMPEETLPFEEPPIEDIKGDYTNMIDEVTVIGYKRTTAAKKTVQSDN